ncbi:hypothetical protein [Photobacterium phosphoreum]|uniref:hypothetical protein n=1 Tax=Photobacterium phosphoreum TaxID=659 RepID=UPI0039AFEFD7
MKKKAFVPLLFLSLNAYADNTYSVTSTGIAQDNNSSVIADFANCKPGGQGNFEGMKIIECNKENEMVLLFPGDGCSSIVKYKQHRSGLEMSQIRIGCDEFIKKGFSSSSITFIK